VQKVGRRLDSSAILTEPEPLIGSMHTIVGQREAHEDCGQSKNLLKQVHDGNCSARRKVERERTGTGRQSDRPGPEQFLQLLHVIFV
jgi:hypothetical protein